MTIRAAVHRGVLRPASDRVTKSNSTSRCRKCQLGVAMREKRSAISGCSFAIPGGFLPLHPRPGQLRPVDMAGRFLVGTEVEFKRRSFMPDIRINIADIDDQLVGAR
jgi:hypothetical protein